MLSEESLRHITDMDIYTLEHLMGQYGQDVWNFAYFLTKDRTMADDIAQDVFLQAFRHVVSFRGESTIKTWLLKITRNISSNYRNSAFIRRVLLVDLVAPKMSHRSAEESFIEKEVANHVWVQVISLPTKYREVLILHAKYQLSTVEIANVLKIPEGTVKSRLSVARKKMTALLKEEEGLLNEPV